MNSHIVYLEPVHGAAYKAELRSDTLWAAICWAIRMIHGNDRLNTLLAAYDHPSNSGDAFYISSAFPYIEIGSKKTHFFPAPSLPFSKTIRQANTGSKDPVSIKLKAREEKKSPNKKKLLQQSLFEYRIGGISEPDQQEIAIKAPEVNVRPMTHNTIDRITGSTLKLNDSGQLFHTDEIFWEHEMAKVKPAKKNDTRLGLFFLISGNMELVKPALAFLQNEGIGGDRSTGKGRFDISEPQPFNIQAPADPNAVMLLSLYHPTEDELDYWHNLTEKRLLNISYEQRRGRVHLKRGKDFLHKKSVMFFQEGSVFPTPPKSGQLGKNIHTHTFEEDFDIQRYGYAFTIPVKIK